MCGYNLYDERLEKSNMPLCKKEGGTIILSDEEIEILQLELRESYKAFKQFDKDNK